MGRMFSELFYTYPFYGSSINKTGSTRRRPRRPGPVGNRKEPKNKTEQKKKVNERKALILINVASQLHEFVTAVEEMKLSLFVRYGLVIIPLTANEGKKISYLLICTNDCIYAIDFLTIDVKTLKILNKIFQNDEITISLQDENTAALLDKYNLFPTRVCVIKKLEKITDTYIIPATCNIDWGQRPISINRISNNSLQIVKPVLNFLNFVKELLADIEPKNLPLVPFLDEHEYSVKLFQDRYYVECIEKYFPNIMALTAQQQWLLNRLLQWRCLLSTFLNKPEATVIPLKFIEAFIRNSSNLTKDLVLSQVHQIEWLDMLEESKLAFGPNYKPQTIKQEQSKVKIVAGKKLGQGLMIAGQDELEGLINILKREKEIGVHGIFGCKFYSVVETLSFLIIATRNEVYIIDIYNFNTKTLQRLHEVFLSHDIIKIFYNSSEMKSRLEDYNLYFANVFDVTENSKNLYYEGDMIQIIAERFPGGDQVCKSKHYWTARPLTGYARECMVFLMKYLPKLYSILKTEMFESDVTVNLLDILPECRRFQSKFCNNRNSLHLTPGQQYAIVKLDEWRNLMTENKKNQCELILPDHVLKLIIQALHTSTWFESLSSTRHLDSFHRRNMKKAVVQILITARSVIGPKFELVQKSDPQISRPGVCQGLDNSTKKFETFKNAGSGENDQLGCKEIYGATFSSILPAGEQYALQKLEEWRRFKASIKNVDYRMVLSNEDMKMLIHTVTLDCDLKSVHTRFPNMSLEEAKDISNILTTSKSVYGTEFGNVKESGVISSQNHEAKTSTFVGQKRPHETIAESTVNSTKKIKTDNLTDCQKYIVRQLENWKVLKYATGEPCNIPYQKMITLSENLQLYSKGSVNLHRNISKECPGNDKAGLKRISKILYIAKLAFDPKLTFDVNSDVYNVPCDFASLALTQKTKAIFSKLDKLRCSIGEARGVYKRCVLPDKALVKILEVAKKANKTVILSLCPNLTTDIAAEIMNIIRIFMPDKVKKNKAKTIVDVHSNFRPPGTPITVNVDQEAPNKTITNSLEATKIKHNIEKLTDCQKYIIRKLTNFKILKHPTGELCELPYHKMITLSKHLQFHSIKPGNHRNILKEEYPGITKVGLRQISKILFIAKLAFDPELNFDVHSDASVEHFDRMVLTQEARRIFSRLDRLRCCIGEARGVRKQCVLPDNALKKILEDGKNVNKTTILSLCPNLTKDIIAEIFNILRIMNPDRVKNDKTKFIVDVQPNFKPPGTPITVNVDQEAPNKIITNSLEATKIKHDIEKLTDCQKYIIRKLTNCKILKHPTGELCELPYHKIITLSENLQLHSKEPGNLSKNILKEYPGITKVGVRQISKILFIAKLAFDPKLKFYVHSVPSIESFDSTVLTQEAREIFSRLDKLRFSIGDARGVSKQCVLPDNALKKIFEDATNTNETTILSLCPNLTKDIAAEIIKIITIIMPDRVKKDKAKNFVDYQPNFKPPGTPIRLNVDQEAPNKIITNSREAKTKNVDVAVNCNVNLHIYNNALCNKVNQHIGIGRTNIVGKTRILKHEIASACISQQQINSNVNKIFDLHTLGMKPEKAYVPNEDTINIKQEVEISEKTIIINEQFSDKFPKIKQEIMDEDTDTEFEEPILKNKLLKKELDHGDTLMVFEGLEMHQDKDVSEENVFESLNIKSETNYNHNEMFALEKKPPEGCSSLYKINEENARAESLQSFLNKIDFESGMFDDYC